MEKLGNTSGSISQWWDRLCTELISVEKQLKVGDEEHAEVLQTTSVGMDQKASPGHEDALAWKMPAPVPTPAVTAMLSGFI